MSASETTQLHLWISRLRTGDRSAFDELFMFYQARLVGLTRKMLGSFPTVHHFEETGDVLQNATIRLMRALTDFASKQAADGGGRDFHTADFFRLAALQIRRELLDLTKHYRRQQGDTPLDRAAEGSGAGAAEPSGPGSLAPTALAEWAEFHEKAATLPDKPREVFQLLWYGGLTQAEVAELLAVDVRTVKSRWQQARLALYDALGGRIPGV